MVPYTPTPAALVDLVEQPEQLQESESNQDAVELVNLTGDSSSSEAENSTGEGEGMEVLSVETGLSRQRRRRDRWINSNGNGIRRHRPVQSRTGPSNRLQLDHIREGARPRVIDTGARLQRSNALHGRRPGALNSFLRRTMNAIWGRSEPGHGWGNAPTFQTLLRDELQLQGHRRGGAIFPRDELTMYLSRMRNWSVHQMRDLLESYFQRIRLGNSVVMTQLVCVMVGMETPTVQDDLRIHGGYLVDFIRELEQLYAEGLLYDSDREIFEFAFALHTNNVSLQDLEDWVNLLDEFGVCDHLYSIVPASNQPARRNFDVDDAFNATLAHSMDHWTEHQAPELDKKNLPTAPPVRAGYIGGFYGSEMDAGCVDCHNRLGVACDKDSASQKSAQIYVRRCGHVYCGDCMEKSSSGLRVRPCKVSGCCVRGKRKAFHPLFL